MKRIIIYIICALIAFLSCFFNLFGTLDKSAEDILYHSPTGTNGKIRIIKIDERTMNELGEFDEWDRSVYAQLVETLCVSDDVRPAVIGFDVLFSSDGVAEADSRFVEACKNHGNVVCGFSYVFSKSLKTDANGNLVVDAMTVSDKVVPFKALADVTNQGFVNALMDNDDNVIRSTFMYFEETENQFIKGNPPKSFSCAVYEAYMNSIGAEPSYPTDESVMSFRYSGTGGDYENISLIDVLNGTVPPQAFDDCIVLVGAYAAGMMDSYLVPVARGEQMYGVEIHANVIQAIMENKTLTALPKWADGFIAAVSVFILMLICEKANVLITILICLGTSALKLIAGGILFNSGYTWNNIIVPVFAVLIAVYYIVLHYYRANAAKRSIEKAFSKYVAPQVVSEIAKSGTYELKLGGENRNVAVLFVDIRGFTPLSESLEPEQVVDILNNYLALTTRCIFRHGGTLDKFVGDATMAVFNAPFDTEDYVYKAVITAWDIVQGGNKIEEQFVERYGKHVGFGVGVNCGPAVVGNIGCDFRMDYTAIGDTVNTAARLEANAPRGTVYISDTIYEQIKDRITVSEVGEIPLKGKSKGVFVYSVTGINDYISEEA